MKTTTTKKLLLLAIALAPACAFAQDYNIAPVDGGLSFLVIAGIGYSIKKIKGSSIKNKKKQRNGISFINQNIPAQANK